MTVTVRLLDGSLSDDVVVRLATEDNSAIGELVFMNEEGVVLEPKLT